MKRVLSVLVLGSLLAAPALAGDNLASKRKLLRDVGLGPDQIKKIEDIYYRTEQDAIDIRRDLQKARLELRRLLSVDQPDERAIYGQLEKISDIDLKLKKTRIGALLAVRKLMTRDQWDKLEAIQAERKAGRWEKWRKMRLGSEPPAPPVPPAAPAP
jgi:Spy/CpxP family protein refolding chaperone